MNISAYTEACLQDTSPETDLLDQSYFEQCYAFLNCSLKKWPQVMFWQCVVMPESQLVHNHAALVSILDFYVLMGK